MKFLAAMLIAVTMAGCAATQIDRARQSVTVGAGLYAGAMKALDAADARTQVELITKVHEGTLAPADAVALYRSFCVKYDIARKALDVLLDALKTTADVTAAADAKLAADIPAAFAALTRALGDVVSALGVLGIKIPGAM